MNPRGLEARRPAPLHRKESNATDSDSRYGEQHKERGGVHAKQTRKPTSSEKVLKQWCAMSGVNNYHAFRSTNFHVRDDRKVI